jgi:predicted exporter
VLEALGTTVAPGALLALAFSALLTSDADGEHRLASRHA